MVIVTLDQNDSTFNWSPRTWWCDSSSCWTIFSKYLYSYRVLKGNGPQYFDRGRSPYSRGILKRRFFLHGYEEPCIIFFFDMAMRRWEFSRTYYCWMWPEMWELDIKVIKQISDPCLVSGTRSFFSVNMVTANVLELVGGFQRCLSIYIYIHAHLCIFAEIGEVTCSAS